MKTNRPLLPFSIFYIIACFLYTASLAQNKIAIQWAHAYGGSLNDDMSCIQPADNGGYIMVGGALSNDGDVSGAHGFGDAWVVKIDATGNIQWQKCLGGWNSDEAFHIQSIENGYIIAGFTTSNDGDITTYRGNGDAWIIKLSLMGNILWQKTYGGSDWDLATDIIPTTDGGYIFTGLTASQDGDVVGQHGTTAGQPDMWVVKINDTGKIQWQKCLGGTLDDQGRSIKQTNDGGYIIAGSTSSNDGDVTGYHDSTDVWVVKLDSVGNLSWQKSLGGTSHDDVSTIRQTSNGGYIVSGTTFSVNGDVAYNHGKSDIWVVTLDKNGNIDRQETYGGSSEEVCFGAKLTSDKGLIICGSTASTDGEVTGLHIGTPLCTDYWLLKVDSTGVPEWQKCLGGTNEDGAYSVLQISDSEYIVGGDVLSNNGDVSGLHGTNHYDYWVAKVVLRDTTTSIITLPYAKQKITIYPNPVTQQLTIIHAAGLTVVMNDVAGKQVYSTAITNDNQTITLPTVPAGAYYLKLYDHSGLQIKAMKVMKE